MAYLYENREEFTNAVNLASEYFHILPIIAEKDYYVTMILRELSESESDDEYLSICTAGCERT